MIAEVQDADWGGLAKVKAQAAHRWCAAVNANGDFGRSDYMMARNMLELAPYLDAVR